MSRILVCLRKDDDDEEEEMEVKTHSHTQTHRARICMLREETTLWARVHEFLVVGSYSFLSLEAISQASQTIRISSCVRIFYSTFMKDKKFAI